MEGERQKTTTTKTEGLKRGRRRGERITRDPSAGGDLELSDYAVVIIHRVLVYVASEAAVRLTVFDF